MSEGVQNDDESESEPEPEPVTAPDMLDVGGRGRRYIDSVSSSLYFPNE